jgi:type I restriction enzyme R subunit
VAFDRPALTRSERARGVRQQGIFDRYEAKARQVLEALLQKYTDEGIEALEKAIDAATMAAFLKVYPFREMGRPIEIIDAFGGRAAYVAAVRQLEQDIYSVA